MAKAAATISDFPGNVVTLRKAPQRRTPVRRPNAELRTREHLTQTEVDRLIEAAKGNRSGHRDATMILVGFRHGLRASELVDLQVGPGRFQCRHPARASGQGRHAGHASTDRLGDARLAANCNVRPRGRRSCSCPSAAPRSPPPAWPGCSNAPAEVRQARDQGAPAHAAARVRLQARQRRRRYAGAAGLPRPQEHPAHRSLHRAGADPVQELLARLKRPRSRGCCASRP